MSLIVSAKTKSLGQLQVEFIDLSLTQEEIDALQNFTQKIDGTLYFEEEFRYFCKMVTIWKYKANNHIYTTGIDDALLHDYLTHVIGGVLLDVPSEYFGIGVSRNKRDLSQSFAWERSRVNMERCTNLDFMTSLLSKEPSIWAGYHLVARSPTYIGNFIEWIEDILASDPEFKWSARSCFKHLYTLGTSKQLEFMIPRLRQIHAEVVDEVIAEMKELRKQN